MSCFICNRETIEAAAYGMGRYGVEIRISAASEREAAARVDFIWDKVSALGTAAEFLAAYNALQFEARYHEACEAVPASRPRRDFTPGEIYGACQCLDYQLWETSDYGTSGTHAALMDVCEHAALEAFAAAGQEVPYGIGGHDMAGRFRVA